MKETMKSPSRTWTLSAARNQFSKVAEKAVREGPQKVTRAGKPSVAVVSLAELERLLPAPGAVAEFFRQAPPMDDLAEAVARMRQ